jgi:recombination protein RecA
MGKHIFYCIPEGRLKDRDISGIKGFRTTNDVFTPIASTKEKLLTAEDHLTICRDIIQNIPECVLIIDSASALCAAKEQTSEITAQARNDGPKLLATFCRQMASVVPVNKTIVIMIQHLIANTSGYGAKFLEDGGNKIQYQCDNKIRCRGKADWMDCDIQVGQVVTWDIETCSLKKPGTKFESYLRYGYGLDKYMETIQLATDLSIIEKGGAWFTLPDGKKLQGENNVRAYLEENEEVYNNICAKIKEFV